MQTAPQGRGYTETTFDLWTDGSEESEEPIALIEADKFGSAHQVAAVCRTSQGNTPFVIFVSFCWKTALPSPQPGKALKPLFRRKSLQKPHKPIICPYSQRSKIGRASCRERV